jgi:hypothetical protein
MLNRYKLFLYTAVLLLTLTASCDYLPQPPKKAPRGHKHYEKWYQERWCRQEGGEVEVRLHDGTRVDCLTDTYAVEFDFASKWAESVGQSLYYSRVTGRKPGIVLIMERPVRERRYLARLKKAVKGLDITVWTVGPEDLK